MSLKDKLKGFISKQKKSMAYKREANRAIKKKSTAAYYKAKEQEAVKYAAVRAEAKVRGTSKSGLNKALGYFAGSKSTKQPKVRAPKKAKKQYVVVGGKAYPKAVAKVAKTKKMIKPVIKKKKRGLDIELIPYKI